jgi:hypothetical protein
MTQAPVTDAAETVAAADARLAGGDVRGAIDLLTQANRRAPSAELELALVRTRVEGCASLPAPTAPPRDDLVAPSEGQAGLFEIAAGELSLAAVRAGLAQSGCVLVRGLVPADRVAHLAAGVEATYDAFDAAARGDDYDHDWFVPFAMPDEIFPTNAGAAVTLSPGAPPAGLIRAPAHRRVTRDGAGIWTVDSPRMLFELFELVDAIGIGELITQHLGERPLLSANKCTLRKVPAEEMSGGWHQDGAFLGKDVGAFNCWMALSRCGRDAPGIDVVARRFDRIVESGSEEAYFKWSLSDNDVLVAAEGAPIVRPEFEAGDALLFDHRLVHRTATAPEMTLERHAIESWWFAPSSFPPSQLPLVY